MEDNLWLTTRKEDEEDPFDGRNDDEEEDENEQEEHVEKDAQGGDKGIVEE